MELDELEFSRRFLQHILPVGFYKIRYYGILASAHSRNLRLQSFALIYHDLPWPRPQGQGVVQVIQELCGRDPSLCPVCGIGRLRMASILGAPG